MHDPCWYWSFPLIYTPADIYIAESGTLNIRSWWPFFSRLASLPLSFSLTYNLTISSHRLFSLFFFLAPTGILHSLQRKEISQILKSQNSILRTTIHSRPQHPSKANPPSLPYNSSFHCHHFTSTIISKIVLQGNTQSYLASSAQFMYIKIQRFLRWGCLLESAFSGNWWIISCCIVVFTVAAAATPLVVLRW